MIKGSFMKTIKIVNIFCCWVVLAGLAACGGGGGGIPSPDSVNVNVSAPVPTRIMGLYSSGSGVGEIVSVVTPDLDFYALYFRSEVTPDIFSGKLDLGHNGAANSTSAGFFYNKNNITQTPVSNVTASFTNSSTQAYSTSLFDGSLQRLSAPGSTVYSPSAIAELSDIQGTWLGHWKDGYAVTGASITISNSGTSTSSTLNNCQLNPVITVIPDANIFKVTLDISSSLNCARGGDLLTGVVVTYKSPLDGKKRLDLVAVDGTGSGISFRGDR
jgi:hypothetical protein